MSDRRQGPSARTPLDCLGGKHQNAELRCATERPYALPTCRGLLSWLTGQIEPQAPAWSVVGNATVVRCNFSL